MITTLVTVLGAAATTVLCIVFAIGGSIVALHDRLPIRLNQRSCQQAAVLAKRGAVELPGEQASAPLAGYGMADENHTAAAAA